MHISKQPSFRERVNVIATNDEMIEYAHVDQCESFLYAQSDQFIRLGRLCNSRRVLGCISGCNHHLLRSALAVHFRTLQVAPASVRGE
jgi:hypothetical protein